MTNESNDTESDIDLGQSDYDRESSDSYIFAYESEDIANEPNIYKKTQALLLLKVLIINKNSKFYLVFLPEMPSMNLYIILSQLHLHLCQMFLTTTTNTVCSVTSDQNNVISRMVWVIDNIICKWTWFW